MVASWYFRPPGNSLTCWSTLALFSLPFLSSFSFSSFLSSFSFFFSAVLAAASLPTGTGSPFSFFSFLFLSILAFGSLPSSSRARLPGLALSPASSSTSSKRLFGRLSREKIHNVDIYLASLSTSPSSSGFISTSELTSRRS